MINFHLKMEKLNISYPIKVVLLFLIISLQMNSIHSHMNEVDMRKAVACLSIMRNAKETQKVNNLIFKFIKKQGCPRKNSYPS